jgi:hypothetical protein
VRTLAAHASRARVWCGWQALEKGFDMVMGMKDKLGGLMSQFGMGAADMSKLDEFKATLDVSSRLLKDPAHTTFVPVCIPEFLSVFETERLVQELTKLDIDVHNIVVNQVCLWAGGVGCGVWGVGRGGVGCVCGGGGVGGGVW